MRQIVSGNLKRELEKAFPHAANLPEAFEKARGVPKETTRRVLVAQNAANLDTLELIADALDLPPYRLLVPPENIVRKFQPEDTGVIKPAPAVKPIAALQGKRSNR